MSRLLPISVEIALILSLFGRQTKHSLRAAAFSWFPLLQTSARKLTKQCMNKKEKNTIRLAVQNDAVYVRNFKVGRVVTR